MHASAILVTLLAATSMAAPSPAIANHEGPGASQFIARQDPRLKQSQDRLQGARNAAMEAIENGGGKGRRLGQTNCGTLCSQCKTGAVTSAVGKIAVCGAAALGLAAASGPIGIFLEVVGFAGCEAEAIGELNKSEAECQTIVG
ncbi:uncharacterized protein CCOS01_15690 [Colletotrichum costaricense]|uniref:Uncharacterized protein n=1 Tax=Colletotrichum costaricense TaxID=1209916 RepID=A0AAJ0DT55_9PEZI|nr:uncharacterized protein CCOS01_15690 [Colletotrichum costaricense]KAK1509174.1 hypothetical protein CCOS01_15690 [Colletotrichum costaricense]